MTVQSAVQTLLSWVVLGSATGIILAIFPIFLFFEQYTLANLCLCVLATFFALKTVQLGINHWDNRMSIPLVFIACGLIGLLLTICLGGINRFVEGKEQAQRSASIHQVPFAATPTHWTEQPRKKSRLPQRTRLPQRSRTQRLRSLPVQSPLLHPQRSLLRQSRTLRPFPQYRIMGAS